MASIFVQTLNPNVNGGTMAFMYMGNQAGNDNVVAARALNEIEPMFRNNNQWNANVNGDIQTVVWFTHPSDKSNAQIIMNATGIRQTINAMINTYTAANSPSLMKEQIIQFYRLLSDLIQFLLATIQKLYYIDGSGQTKPSGMTEEECLDYVKPAAELINKIYVKVMENRFASSLLSKVVMYDINNIKRENKKALGDFGSGGSQAKIRKKH